MTFRVDPPPISAENLVDWVYRQLQEVQNAFERGHLLPRWHNEPGKKVDGAFYYADGSDWNPGSGPGAYRYDEPSDSYKYWENLPGAGGSGGKVLNMWSHYLDQGTFYTHFMNTVKSSATSRMELSLTGLTLADSTGHTVCSLVHLGTGTALTPSDWRMVTPGCFVARFVDTGRPAGPHDYAGQVAAPSSGEGSGSLNLRNVLYVVKEIEV